MRTPGQYANSGSRLIQFVITKALPYIFDSFAYGTWFFFACWMLIACVWAFFFLPETKGRTLEEFDTILYVIYSPDQADRDAPLLSRDHVANYSVLAAAMCLTDRRLAPAPTSRVSR